MVTLTQYISTNKKVMVTNWKDEFIRQKYDSDLSIYIKSKCERLEHIVYNNWVTANIPLDLAKHRLTEYLTKNIRTF